MEEADRAMLGCVCSNYRDVSKSWIGCSDEKFTSVQPVASLCVCSCRSCRSAAAALTAEESRMRRFESFRLAPESDSGSFQCNIIFLKRKIHIWRYIRAGRFGLLAGFSARRRKEASAPKVCCVWPPFSSTFVRKQSPEFHLGLNSSDATAERVEEA